MEKIEKQLIRSLDEFNEDISLWQLLSTKGSGLKTLKLIVDAELNTKIGRNKPLTLLITGAYGKRTHARAFLRALGIENINEIPANLLNWSKNLIDFFHESNPSDGYVITDFQNLGEASKFNLYQILTTGKFQQFKSFSPGKDIYSATGIIVMTATKKELVSEHLFRNIEYHVEIGELNQELITLATLQRIKYSNLTYESEEVLSSIVEHGHGNINLIVKFLQMCFLLLRKQNENQITMKIVDQASKLII